MSDVSTFLVPVDLNDCTSDVVQKASELAEVNGARVVLLHAVRPPDGVPAHVAVRDDDRAKRVDDLLVEEAEPRLDEHVQALRDAGVDASRQIVIGEPVSAILGATEELSPELIVMGTHGRAGLSRLLLGSVADKVSRKAPCPVVTVRTEWRESCDAKSCDWCDKHVSPGARSVAAESDG
ncbi:MAG: universal stress protein [Deltaproteobacteria bacterium]|nr:universal stress protein [Deltaproteobacteria bacterium]MBW2533758.1 universal stress protein [Deltaproteobacteria bacterium]